MGRYIQQQKMSKRQRKELNSRKRNTWTCDPRTKIVQDKTKYNRNKENSNLKHMLSCDNWQSGGFENHFE